MDECIRDDELDTPLLDGGMGMAECDGKEVALAPTDLHQQPLWMASGRCATQQTIDTRLPLRGGRPAYSRQKTLGASSGGAPDQVRSCRRGICSQCR